VNLEQILMLTPDPWAFGLDHLFTIIGFCITILIAIAGFRSFHKWKRERIEERRINIALEALALAYEAKFIFNSIRGPMSFESEWSDMQSVEDPERRRAAGPYFATLKRIEYHEEYFKRAWKVQPRFMAVFGKDATEIFMKLHQARRRIEVSASMLMRAEANAEPMGSPEFLEKLRHDVWELDPENDQVGLWLSEFVEGIEQHCLPVITHRGLRLREN
jgi:hypothetical protein